MRKHSDKPTVIGLNVPRDLLDAIDDKAREKQQPRSTVILSILRKHLENTGK